MRHITAMLLILSFLFALSACGESKTAPMKTETQTTVSAADTRETSAAVTETAAPTARTTQAADSPAASSEPTEEDLDRLETVLFWGSFFAEDYDCKTSKILDYIWACGAVPLGMNAFDLLKEDENYVHCEYYADSGRAHGGDDPRGVFKSSCYRMIRADVMEYYLENVFNNNRYVHERESYRTDEDGNRYCNYYYEDGWYYFYCEHYGLEDETVRVTDVQKQPDGRYRITAVLAYGDGFTQTADEYDTIVGRIRIDASLAEKDGRRLWSITNIKVLESESY